MKKIIFDLDDTLYVENNLRKKREDAILNFLDNRKEEYFKLKEKKNGTIESFKLMGFSRQDFFKIMENVPIFLKKDNRLIEILNQLKKRYNIYILSNSSEKNVKETLNQLGILNLVNEYYYGEKFYNEKPAKECFFMVESGDICVGNSFKKDLNIPKKMGAITILVGSQNDEADYCIEEIYDILEVINKIENKINGPN